MFSKNMIGTIFLCKHRLFLVVVANYLDIALPFQNCKLFVSRELTHPPVTY